jgi:hypothetical protein
MKMRKSKIRKGRPKTILDDLRRIREQFDRESGGDIHKHAEQTRLATAPLIKKLGLRVVSSPTPQLRRQRHK